jgi:hypothetical protein
MLAFLLDGHQGCHFKWLRLYLVDIVKELWKDLGYFFLHRKLEVGHKTTNVLLFVPIFTIGEPS